MPEDENEMQCRKLLLDFYSSQINTHGRLIIGFSVVLFAIVEIRISPMVANNLSALQNRILYFGIFLAGFALSYLFFRYITYGTLADYTIQTPWREPVGDKTKMCNVDSFMAEVSNKVEHDAQLRRLLGYFTTSTRQVS